MLVAAGLYYGEARYRVPYDCFLLLLSAVVVDVALGPLLRWADRMVGRAQHARRARAAVAAST
jgi:hypothetical protein